MKLTQLQSDLLKAISQTQLVDYFYWTGGTLLSFHYLRHRHSEDLDFFSQDLVPEEQVLHLITTIKKELRLNQIKQIVKLNRQQYQLSKGQETLQLEFVYFPFKPLTQPELLKTYNLKIDSLLDIAANKIFALYERIEPKDVVDLYFINQDQKWSIDKLIKLAVKKFSIEIDQALLVAKAVEAADKLRLIQPLLSKKADFSKLSDNIKSLFIASGKKYLSPLLK